MATLVAVMRNEFGEGMTVAGATSEASQEVVAPGRTLVVIAASGQPKAWGLPLSMPTTSVLASAPDRQTVATSAGAMRVLRRTVDDGPGRQFTALVVAPLREIEFQQTEMVRAMFIGVVCALLIAGAGGWLIGRKTLPRWPPWPDKRSTSTPATHVGVSSCRTLTRRSASSRRPSTVSWTA